MNPKGALGTLSALTSNARLAELVAAREPILAVFNGTPEQIHGASRTRITGLIMDVMLFESLGKM
jgi:hypothetical protein